MCWLVTHRIVASWADASGPCRHPLIRGWEGQRGRLAPVPSPYLREGELRMSQFSVPLGIITASVIAGAAYLSHVTPKENVATAKPAETSTVASAPVDSGDTTTTALPAAAPVATPPVKIASASDTPAPRARVASAAPARASSSPAPSRSAPVANRVPADNPVSNDNAPAPATPASPSPEPAAVPAPAATPPAASAPTPPAGTCCSRERARSRAAPSGR